MNNARSWKPSPSMAVALMALFVALAGTAWAAGLKKNSVKSKQIKNGQVRTQDIGDGAVATTDLADGAVTAGKIAAGVIPSGLADGSVTTPKLADGSVTTSKLADGAINSAKVADNSLVAADLGNDSVGQGELASSSVTSTDLLTNAVTTSALANNAVRGSDVYANVSDTFDPGSIPGNNCTSVDRTTGLLDSVVPSDQVFVTPPPGLATGVLIKVTAESGQVRLDMCNLTGLAIDPPSEAYDYLVIAD